jgi:ubiquinone/menaquinone biosynthesis C-methylase UbiE
MNIVKQQFNSQADNFHSWAVTKNTQYMQRYADFINISKTDSILDVACGSGDFAVFMADKAMRVHGVDISEGMIEIAKKQARANHLNNIDFECHDVEYLPCRGHSFSVVLCKSAFHHMKNYTRIFKEMTRCCHPDGRLSVQDITTYDNRKVNDYFEKFEKEVDISHHATLSKADCFQLFDQNNMDIIRSLVVEIELNFNDYLSHAHQTKARTKKH